MRFHRPLFLGILFLLMNLLLACGGEDGPVDSHDGTPPADVADLSVAGAAGDSAVLVWTAPGDDGWQGTAATYDLRRSPVRILEEAWSTRTQIAGEPSPRAALSPETLTVTGLTAPATTHFAIRTADEAGNWSGVSNSAVFLEGEPSLREVRPDGLGDYPTIQAAIDSAAEGDTILLAPGIFRGEGNRDLDFRGKELLLRSRDGSVSGCVIDCEGSSSEPHRAFHFHSGEETTTVVEAVTMRRGNTPGEDGGAVQCNGASPLFRRCVVESCSARNGGAFGLFDGAPRFEECVFRNNESPHMGGAVHSENASPIFDNCTFSENRVVFLGGGVSGMDYGDSLLFVNCRFENNEADQGGGAYIYQASVLFERCTFAFNQAGDSPGRAGGLFLNGGPQKIVDCTFQSNRSNQGGGLCALDCDTLAMYGNTFLANEAGTDGGGMILRNTPSRIDHGLFRGNTAANQGGGLCVEFGRVRLVETYFSGNDASSGAGVHHACGRAVIDSCVFYFNEADERGGGIAAEDSLVVTRSTFNDNAAPSGTAIHVSGGGAPSIGNTIVAFNDAGDPVAAEGGTSPVLSCCDVFGNTGGDWVGVIAAQAGADGNFSEDPLFCDHLSGDVHLHENSPCANRAGCGWIGLEPVGCWE